MRYYILDSFTGLAHGPYKTMDAATSVAMDWEEAHNSLYGDERFTARAENRIAWNAEGCLDPAA